MSKAKTIRELKASGWQSRTVRQEMEENLVRKLKAGDRLFPGIVGFEDTVLPQLENAILAGHDLILLGEKGQAKSRILRNMVHFLDEEVPVIAGCEINDNPYAPICKRCRNLVVRDGEDVAIAWWPRALRYGERLAPGSRIGDLIGDLDPAKVAGGSVLSSEDALHFGLIPRMHRGLFAINELPDLEYLVQVALFNILEERDIQIRGYPIRFDLDVRLMFTANPEEYSRSGKIISQLKDRIGAEIRTHYPMTREVGMAIIEQEAHVPKDGVQVTVPTFMKHIIEQITMEARKSPYVNQKSGVSARLSIANFETMIANSRRRAMLLNEGRAVPRISDLNYLYTSSFGKIELDPFREETVTEFQVVTRIFEKAIKIVFDETIDEETQASLSRNVKGDVMVEVSDQMPAASYQRIIPKIPAMWDAVHHLGGDEAPELQASCIEFLLEGLYASNRVSRSKLGDLVTYRSR
ncbi:MAG TPA: magnesium chelatase [Candidatus Xenobia bacterium]|jgi:magnesium chelatase subunit I